VSKVLQVHIKSVPTSLEYLLDLHSGLQKFVRAEGLLNATRDGYD
jgi:hypothetical protein